MNLKRSQTMDAILSTRRRSLLLGGLGMGTLVRSRWRADRPGLAARRCTSGETMGSTTT
jgi:hypothetical protein